MTVLIRFLVASVAVAWSAGTIATALPQDGGENDEVGLCRDLPDDRAWREKTCEDPLVQENTLYSLDEQWTGLDVGGAWDSAIDFVKCRMDNNAPENSFTNMVSDFFHGPQSMFCESFEESGNGCIDLATQCHDVTHPAGYYLLNSLSRVYSMNWNAYTALTDALAANNITNIAADFGTVASTINPHLNIFLDIAMMGFGFIMGPTWNRLIVPKHPNYGSTVKDEVNDMVKNSATLSKDLYTKSMRDRAADEAELENMMNSIMLAMVDSWINSIRDTNSILFDGSEASNRHLSAIMSEGAMVDFQTSVEETLDAIGMRDRYLQIMNAIMVQQTWRHSHEELYPVIIKEENMGCNQYPNPSWTDPFVHHMSQEAFDSRMCDDEDGTNSFWLVGPKKLKESCTKIDYSVRCDSWDVLPGMDQLKDNVYRITVEDVIVGSGFSHARNDGKNGYEPGELTTDMIEEMDFWGIRTAGIFTIPICSFGEAYSNWRDAYEGKIDIGPNFPCNSGLVGDAAEVLESALSPLHNALGS